MRLEIKDPYIRILRANKQELYCFMCGTKEARDWYYCEQAKKPMCFRCGRGQRHVTVFDHMDFKIDEIRYEEEKD